MQKWLLSILMIGACLFAVYLMTFTMPKKEQAAEGPKKVTLPNKTVDADAAMSLYKTNCLSCHGDKLQGKMGPELDHIGSSMTKEDIYKQINNGGGGMPKFQGRLTDDQVVTVSLWLSEMK